MDWQDEGIVLSARSHGERDSIVSALTFEHGRHLGLVIAGTGRRARPLLQPGNRLALSWKARLSEHLGNYTVEPMQLLGSRLIADPTRLLGLAAVTDLIEATAPEREPHPRLYAALLRLLEGMIDDPSWPQTFVRFEIVLLADLGFALGLEVCAVTGETGDLVYVSPRTGRAVSRGGAGDFADRMLPLPAFLRGAEAATSAEIAAGLRLTGHFLQRHLLDPADRLLPAARERLAQRFAAPVSENDG